MAFTSTIPATAYSMDSAWLHSVIDTFTKVRSRAFKEKMGQWWTSAHHKNLLHELLFTAPRSEVQQTSPLLNVSTIAQASFTLGTPPLSFRTEVQAEVCPSRASYLIRLILYAESQTTGQRLPIWHHEVAVLEAIGVPSVQTVKVLAEVLSQTE